MWNDLNSFTHIAGSILVLHLFNLPLECSSLPDVNVANAVSTQRESMSHVCRIPQWKII